MTINIVYWSGTGNTKAMAELIEEGAKSAGASVVLTDVSAADAAKTLNADVVALGCPSMGSDELEETEFEPFIESIEDDVRDKKLALFGSYGWGDGQWMRDWTQRMEKAGARLVVESLVVNETPQGEAELLCKEFGARLVKYAES